MINDSGGQMRACNPCKWGGDQERGRLEDGLGTYRFGFFGDCAQTEKYKVFLVVQLKQCNINHT